ncbi:MAG TPA: hypothetical protein ENK31_09735, partial [Nannocystis exedens]|nr:hypothetical protein [Nannocystis exedens]
MHPRTIEERGDALRSYRILVMVLLMLFLLTPVPMIDFAVHGHIWQAVLVVCMWLTSIIMLALVR